MSSKPFAIANLKKERTAQFLSTMTSPASSVSSSSRLYVPVHKRQPSLSGSDKSFASSSSSISSRPSSRAESHVESESGLGYHNRCTTGVYTREALLALAKSPFSVMPKDVKDGLRETVPEIVMSRKYRKALEYRARTQQQHQAQITSDQKETNAPSADPQRLSHHSQEPQNRGRLLQSQDSSLLVPAEQKQQPEHSRRQMRLRQSQHQKQQHAAPPRANQQKRWTSISTGANTRPHDADVNWRMRPVALPSIAISAA